jgi:hypothetical protein
LSRHYPRQFTFAMSSWRISSLHLPRSWAISGSRHVRSGGEVLQRAESLKAVGLGTSPWAWSGKSHLRNLIPLRAEDQSTLRTSFPSMYIRIPPILVLIPSATRQCPEILFRLSSHPPLCPSKDSSRRPRITKGYHDTGTPRNA